VIVVGPELKLQQCGLPKKMALELLKPFIYSRLEAKGLSATVKQSKKMVEKERPEVWDILDEVIREHPVMLNRAPTLHRLGIQAFEPVLIEGKAIQLHPLVCAAFNADFDGDQMAVHVPLSLEAQLEARVLMMSTNNILHPANGAPIIVPSQDIVLGLYYMTLQRDGLKGEGMLVADVAELEHALDTGALTLHTKIKARVPSFDADGNQTTRIVDTTVGRFLLSQELPLHPSLPYETIDKLMTKKEISTVLFCDHIMKIGFREACNAGISFGKDDMVIPEDKIRLIEETKALATEYEQQYIDGLITQGEKYNKVVDAWARCTDRVADAMMGKISTVDADGTEDANFINSIYMMSHSGARGSPAQMKQLAGMRGLMAKPSGEIIETPIISNFKEGLSVLEYFNSTHGARKGLADTALKTANSGYLTRRLVDVAQDSIVNEYDCGTQDGITVAAVIDAGEVIASLSDRVLGRTPCDDVVNPATNAVIVKRGQLISEEHLDAIEEANLVNIKIRSALTCETKSGICGACYGRDLARGTPVNIGEAVGVIAAQSIGEPGTQLTMRTFHIGGTAQVVDQSFIESNADGKVVIENANIVKDSSGRSVVMGRNVTIKVVDNNGLERASHKLSYGARLRINEGDEIKRGERIAEWEPYAIPILTELDGIVEFEDLVEGVSILEITDEATGISQRVVADASSQTRGADLKPAMVVKDEKGNIKTLSNGNEARFILAPNAILSVEGGATVHAGDILARIPSEGATSSDITGGLPRVAELFEARRPKDHAIIAEITGRVEFGRDYKNKRRIVIHPENADLEPVEYLVPKAKHLSVQEGDVIEKGEYLIDGHPAPHDILAISGVEELAAYLVNEIQDVYRLQGVTINDKHIEVIVRQMLQKVEITSIGEGDYLKDEQVDRIEFEEACAKLEAEGKQLPTSVPILLGITKASLQTRSFISAASFQETTRVLTEAAINGKYDELIGLKENVIVGRLIPAGTGGLMQRLKGEAAARDAELEAQNPAPILEEEVAEDIQL
jgi:DNA-directed RNA polymerase subunit beta'